jgi:hypothetical protein
MVGKISSIEDKIRISSLLDNNRKIMYNTQLQKEKRNIGK